MMKRLMAMAGLMLLCGCSALRLDVQHGSGSGRYDPLEIVPIVADTPDKGYVFESWHGDISGISDSAKPETTIMMNQVSKTIVAAYKQITPPPPPPPPPPPVNVFIEGDSFRDGGGEEVYRNSGVCGIELRVDANDSGATPEVCEGFFFIKGDLIDDQQALTWYNDGEDLVVVAKDFRGHSGILYRHLGFTKYYSASPVIREHIIRIPRNQLHDTLRSYWGSVEG